MEWLKIIADGGAVVAMIALIVIFLKFVKVLIDRFLQSQNEERDRAERIFEKQSDTVQGLADAIGAHDQRSSEQHSSIIQAVISTSSKNGSQKNHD